MDLNVLACMAEYLPENGHGVLDLTMSRKNLGLGDLPYDKGVVKSRRVVVERARGAHHVRRIGFRDVADAQVVESLPMQRLIRFKSSQFSQGRDCFPVIPFAHCRFGE